MSGQKKDRKREEALNCIFQEGSLFGVTEEEDARRDGAWEVNWNKIMKGAMVCQGVYSLGNIKEWKVYIEYGIIG